jgi:hypothetical protein
MKLFAAILILYLLAAPAHALTEEQNSDGTERTMLDYIEEFVDVPEGAIDWKIFGATKEVAAKGKTDDGYDIEYTKPEFSPELKMLDGKEITVKGFMFPLEAEEKQKLFLFGPFPVSCPFHYHAGPSLILQVNADENPVQFDYDPVVITGTLELVPDDPEYNTFYRLKNARKVNK